MSLKMQDLVDEVEEATDWPTHGAMVRKYGRRLVQQAIDAKAVLYRCGFIGPVEQHQPLLRESRLALDELMAQPIARKLHDAAVMMRDT